MPAAGVRTVGRRAGFCNWPLVLLAGGTCSLCASVRVACHADFRAPGGLRRGSTQSATRCTGARLQPSRQAPGHRCGRCRSSRPRPGGPGRSGTPTAISRLPAHRASHTARHTLRTRQTLRGRRPSPPTATTPMSPLSTPPVARDLLSPRPHSAGRPITLRWEPLVRAVSCVSACVLGSTTSSSGERVRAADARSRIEVCR